MSVQNFLISYVSALLYFKSILVDIFLSISCICWFYIMCSWNLNSTLNELVFKALDRKWILRQVKHISLVVNPLILIECNLHSFFFCINIKLNAIDTDRLQVFNHVFILFKTEIWLHIHLGFTLPRWRKQSLCYTSFILHL